MNRRHIPQLTDPLRFPNRARKHTRNVRGVVLLLLTILIPGAVQSLLGNRKIARLCLSVTLITWALILVIALLALLWRPIIFTLVTNPLALTPLTIWAALSTCVWVVCLIDTVLRIRPGTLSGRTRISVLAGALVCLVVIGGGMGWATVTLNSQRHLMAQMFSWGLAKGPVNGRFNIALLGSDAGKGRVGVRPDSISLVSIDAKTGDTLIIGLPRNMENVPFPSGTPLAEVYPHGYNCGDECLLNAVYQLGEKHAEAFRQKPAGAAAMKDAITAITGLKVQYYAMIDLKGFEDLIDALGGIDLVSHKRVPVSSPVNKSTGQHGPVREWIEPGKLHLDGFHALWYARSREFSSDYERMIRQRCVQKAMLAQLDPATVLLRYQAIAAAAPQVISTDIPQLQVDRFVRLAIKAKKAGIESLNLTPPRVNPGSPNYSEIHQMIQQEFQTAQALAMSDMTLAAPRVGAVSGASRAIATSPTGAQVTSMADKANSICEVPH